MDADIWEILGLAATDDERAIKRAYAAKVKITSPESDAAGYMKLRAAYEHAKRWAASQREMAQWEAQHPNGETQDAEGNPTPDVVPVHPEPVTPRTPQQRAFQELRALLERRELAPFLEKVEQTRDAGVFTTLDEQHDFIGEVACLVQDFQIDDLEWRGKLAEVLGARERDNIFAQYTRYFYAYGELLESYGQMRDARMQAHALASADAVAPGYLHVYHVLTAPFDAERLNALARSQNYSRLGDSILERARQDPTIVIPPENREWWERTSMARQRNFVPEPDPPPQPVQAVQEETRGFPGWAIWMIVVVLFQLVRCAGSSYESPSASRSSFEERYDRQQMTRILEDYRMTRRISMCDQETLEAIRARMKELGIPPRPSPTNTQRMILVPDASDPQTAALLEKCPIPPDPPTTAR